MDLILPILFNVFNSILPQDIYLPMLISWARLIPPHPSIPRPYLLFDNHGSTNDKVLFSDLLWPRWSIYGFSILSNCCADSFGLFWSRDGAGALVGLRKTLSLLSLLPAYNDRSFLRFGCFHMDSALKLFFCKREDNCTQV